MITELKSTDEFENFETKQDGIGLLALNREVMRWVKRHVQNTRTLVQANKALHTFWQVPTVSNDEYLKLFNARVTVLETLGGRLPMQEALVIVKLKTMGVSAGDLGKPEERPDRELYMKAFESAQKEYLALLVLSGANATQFG